MWSKYVFFFCSYCPMEMGQHEKTSFAEGRKYGGSETELVYGSCNVLDGDLKRLKDCWTVRRLATTCFFKKINTAEVL